LSRWSSFCSPLRTETQKEQLDDPWPYSLPFSCDSCPFFHRRGGQWSSLVDGPSAPSLLKVVFSRSAGGCAFSCFAPIFSEIFEEDFLSGGSTMRCRVPSSSATDEIVPKQNMEPGRRMILCWKVTAIELAWIGDTPPTWRASCRCFGSDRAPGVAPQCAFWSRTVLPTVARWFVLMHERQWTVLYRFGPLGDA
jgi:hypothetical protein